MPGLSVEIERGGLRDTGGVGHAQYLEVVVLVQPVAGYGFGKAQGYIVLQCEDAVGFQYWEQEEPWMKTFIFTFVLDNRIWRAMLNGNPL